MNRVVATSWIDLDVVEDTSWKFDPLPRCFVILHGVKGFCKINNVVKGGFRLVEGAEKKLGSSFTLNLKEKKNSSIEL